MNSKPRLDMEEIDKKNSIHYKYCAYCGKAIPRTAEVVCCSECQETIIFHAVRDFIRENVVNEFQVADYFGIPLRMVKRWIREGRIEYVEAGDGRTIIAGTCCEHCGAPITFGTVCSKCLKLMNESGHGYGVNYIHEDDKMRYLDITKKRQ